MAQGHRLRPHRPEVMSTLGSQAMATLTDAAADDRQGVRELVSLINSGALAQALRVAAELRIPDLLAGGPKQVEDLACATGSHAPSLRRLLKALSSIGVCRERDDGSFALDTVGALVRSDGESSLRSWVLWFGRYQWPMWGNLLRSVKTGESARKAAYGTDGFGHLERDAEAATVFDNAMTELSRLVADEVVAAYDFTGLTSVVDVGGGRGALVCAILEAHPSIRGTVLDRPHAFAAQDKDLARCDFVVGDFFQSVPAADLYLLKNVIHDWDDEQSVRILRNCRTAMPAHGRMLVIERVMPERLESTARHRTIAWADLAMLVGPGGKERTEAEFRALLDHAGIGLRSVIPTATEYTILEAVPR